jgi:DedD protein
MVMASDLKQRIVGMVVLIFLALITLPWLLGRGQPTITKPLPKFKTPIESSSHLTAINGPKLATIENSIVHTQAVAIKMEPQPIERAVIKVKPQPIENKLQVIDIEKPDLTAIKITVKDSPTKAIAGKALIAVPAPTSRDLFAGSSKDADFGLASDPRLSPGAQRRARMVTKAAGNEKHFIIQLGSFSNQANVNKLVKQLKAKKFPVYSRSSQTKGITLIFVGPFLHQYEAREKIKQIEELTTVHGMVIKNKANAFSTSESVNSCYPIEPSKRSRL